MIFLWPTPVGAQASDDDDEVDSWKRSGGLSLGSKQGEWVTLSADAWLPALKKTSQFTLGISREALRGPHYTQDLGISERQIVGGGTVRVNLDKYGWIGAECLYANLTSDRGSVEYPRELNDLELRPGDRMASRATFLWGRLHGGYEIRYRFLLAESVPLDLFVSPTLGVGIQSLDLHTRRIYPDAERFRGGHIIAWAIAPGARVGVEILDVVTVGADLEWLPRGNFLSPAKPSLTEWERFRTYVGGRLWGIELTVGYRYLNTTTESTRSRSDIKVRGFDFTVGVRF